MNTWHYKSKITLVNLILTHQQASNKALLITGNHITRHINIQITEDHNNPANSQWLTNYQDNTTSIIPKHSNLTTITTLLIHIKTIIWFRTKFRTWYIFKIIVNSKVSPQTYQDKLHKNVKKIKEINNKRTSTILTIRGNNRTSAGISQKRRSSLQRILIITKDKQIMHKKKLTIPSSRMIIESLITISTTTTIWTKVQMRVGLNSKRNNKWFIRNTRLRKTLTFLKIQ